MDKIILSGNRYDYEEVTFHKKTILDSKAEFATEMLIKWGMVTGVPDGEDSAGRAKLKVMPVDELVQRACETAEKAFTEFEKRGWILEVPTPQLREKVTKNSTAAI